MIGGKIVDMNGGNYGILFMIFALPLAISGAAYWISRHMQNKRICETRFEMGMLRCHFFSEVFQTHTDITLTLPEVAMAFSPDDLRGKRVLYPVLYVMHGGAEESTMWMRMSRIEEYSKRYNFISVSINGMSSAYSDMVHGYKIFTFLTEELPKFVEGVFPASPKREDRYIAGFSMGGQGTLKAAFRRPELYAAAMPLVARATSCRCFKSGKPWKTALT